GEDRVSNFLLWEAVDTPFYVTSAFWPDFDGDELAAAVAWWRQQEEGRVPVPGAPGGVT
ncbi:MAG: undecaprenyl diphosphate synthase family protein, partial [Acidimicrobiales bacterium]